MIAWGSASISSSFFIASGPSRSKQELAAKFTRPHFIPDLTNHSHARNLTRKLIERGFSDEQIAKILFGNWMRISLRRQFALKFINLTRRTEIGANSYYLEAAGQRLVLDCGMHPKEEGEDALPNFRALGDRALDAIVISHSHLDHIGTLPVLMRRQPDARIFMTEATAEIGSALLHNSVSVMTRQREEIGVSIYPLFTHKETDRATDRWRWCPMGQPFTLEGERAKPHEAGRAHG